MTDPTGVPPTAIEQPDVPEQGSIGALLSDLRGRWVGEGINTLWVPTTAGLPSPAPPPTYTPPNQPTKPLPQFVSSRTTETLVVRGVLGSVPNKGPGDAFGELSAPYEQRAYDENGNLIHAETGFWLVTPPTTSPSAAASVAKLSSIPHGTVAIVQGPLPARQNGASRVSVPNVAPVIPAIPVDGLSEPSGPLDQPLLDNVASYIQLRMDADRTGLLWELQLASIGVANIDFLTANARVTSVQSTVWVGNLGIRTDAGGEQTASILAYVQTALVNFDGIDWPHISVGYLTRDMEWRDSD